MQIGKLKHKIEIQQKNSTQDSTGAMIENWTRFAEARAAIWSLSASEHLSMGKLQGEITHQVRIRYLPGVTSAMRVVFNGRILEIVAPPINKDERNVMLEMLCREVE